MIHYCVCGNFTAYPRSYRISPRRKHQPHRYRIPTVIRMHRGVAAIIVPQGDERAHVTSTEYARCDSPVVTSDLT